jgi:hypothetical protein
MIKVGGFVLGEEEECACDICECVFGRSGEAEEEKRGRRGRGWVEIRRRDKN